MYLYREQAKDLLKEVTDVAISDLEQKNEFMFSLLEGDDWSMIIKSHALVESLVTELIVSITEEPVLKSTIERLPLSDEQIGKIKIAKDYELLTSSQRTFIKKISELRNNLVHKFENIDFNLSEYITTLDKNQKKSWQKIFTWYEKDKEKNDSWSEATLNNPKLAIWLSIYMFVSLTVVKINELKGLSKIRVASLETANELLNE